METFKCSICGLEKEVQKNGGTGYATNDKEEKVCYACCAITDKEYMQNNSRMTLYFDGNIVCNWPGTLRINPSRIRQGNHTLTGKRVDIWFSLNGYNWHGVQYGHNTQILHCQKVQ